MRSTTSSLLAAAALMALAAAPALPQETAPPRRAGKQPRKLEGEYLGQQSQEIKDWNAAVEAKKAAKRERKQIREAQS